MDRSTPVSVSEQALPHLPETARTDVLPEPTNIGSLHAWARYYARVGLPIFPLEPRGKSPLFKGWQGAATTDVAQIDAWWTAHPDANIGMPTGARSGLFVVDLDISDAKNGPDRWAELLDAHGDEGAPIEAKTGSGGTHLLYRHVDGVTNSKGRLANGIDVRGEGGLIAIAPSVHPNGGIYKWVGRGLEQKAELPPAWLANLLVRTRLPDAAPVRIEGSHTLTREDLEAFITYKAKYEDAAPLVRAARAVLDGTSWGGIGERDQLMHSLVGALQNWAIDKHGAPLDPDSSSVLFDACTAAVSEQGVRDPTDRHYIADKLRRSAQGLPAFRGKIEAAREAKKALLPSGDLELPEVLDVPEQTQAVGAITRGVKPSFNAYPLQPNPVIDELIGILSEHPAVFRDSYNQLSRTVVVDDPQELPLKIEPASVDWLSPILSDVADWFTVKKDEHVYVPATNTMAAQLIARRNFPGVRRLGGVSLSPFFRADGTLCTQEGYDEASGQWLCLQGLVLPTIPENPSREDARAAAAKLKEPFCDFRFTDPSMMSVCLSAILTPLARPRHSPVHLTDAANAGTGKSLSQKLCTSIPFGQRVKSEAWSLDETEQGKVVVGAAVAGRPYLWLNNLDRSGTLGGSALEGVVADGSTGRILGQSKNAPSLTHCTFLANGNNVQMSRDMQRRTLRARLVATQANPSLRDTSQFRFADVEAHVAEHRGEYLAAALTILRAYFAAKSPPQQVQSLAFPEWEKTVASALVWAGEPDPGQHVVLLAGEDALDPTTEALTVVVEAIKRRQEQNASATTNPRDTVRPGELLTMASEADVYPPTDSSVAAQVLSDALAVLIPDDRKRNAQSVGLWLARRKDEVFASNGTSLQLQGVYDKHSKTWGYKVDPLGVPPIAVESLLGTGSIAEERAKLGRVP